MAALAHGNLATILEQQSWRGTPILVCEYLHGGTLQHRLQRGPLSIDAALTLVLTLLDALDYMHRHDVLHRDIKPSNIGFTADGVAKLLDFGLAALVERSQARGQDAAGAMAPLASTLAGTLGYLPPQAFEGGRPTPFFDHWALAVVLFEAIEGYHPFAEGPDTVSNICRGRVRRGGTDRDRRAQGVHDTLSELLSSRAHPKLSSSITLRETLVAMRGASSKGDSHAG